MNMILRENNPFKLLDKTFDEFLSGNRWPRSLNEISYPAIDVEETPQDVRVTAELPGVKKEDIDISIDQHMLHIKGEKRQEKSAKDGNNTWSERTYGSFGRTIALPSEVDTTKVEANFKNGVLEVRLPKSEQAQHRKISIQGE